MGVRSDYTTDYIDAFYDGYEAMSNAVVTRAAFDYREYCTRMMEIESELDAFAPFEFELTGYPDLETVAREVYEGDDKLKENMRYLKRVLKHGDQENKALMDEVYRLKRWTRRKMRLLKEYDDLSYEVDGIEEFFKGDDITLFTDLNGVKILKRLKEELAA